MSSRYVTAEIPIGLNGLSGLFNKAGIIGFLDKTESVYYRFNTLGKAPGASKLNATSFNAIVRAGASYYPTPTTERHVVFLSDGRMLKLSAAGDILATLATGLNDASSPVFVRGGKEGAALATKLFCFTGTNQVKVLSGDGTTVTNITTPPADWSASFPKSGFVFDGRLCGFGNENDPHRLYFSRQTNHEDFVGTGSLTIPVHPGEYIGLSAAVPVQHGVVLFKNPRGIYFLDAKDPVSSNWRIFKLSDDVGVFHQNAVTSFGGMIFYIGTDGHIYSISLTELIGLKLINLTNENRMYDRLYYAGDMLDISKTSNARLVFYDIEQEVIGRFDDLTGKTTSVIVDFVAEKPRFRTSSKDDVISFWTNQTGNLFFGDRTGFVWKALVDGHHKDGQGYEFRAKTQEYDFSHIDPALGAKNKNWAFVEIHYIPLGTTSLSMTVYLDGKNSGVFAIPITSGGTAGRLGSFSFGDGTTLESSVSSDVLRTAKTRITGESRRIALEFSNVSTKPISISRILVHFGVGDERV